MTLRYLYRPTRSTLERCKFSVAAVTARCQPHDEVIVVRTLAFMVVRQILLRSPYTAPGPGHAGAKPRFAVGRRWVPYLRRSP